VVVFISVKLTDDMKIYEKETGKRAIWRGNITKNFKKWKKGEKIHIEDKERVCILVTEEVKKQWQNFTKQNQISTTSKLIREGVKFFMNFKSSSPNLKDLADIYHYLKEPLTSIKGFSEILIERHKHELDWDILLKMRKIFEQSQILEERIGSLFLDKFSNSNQPIDILIVDDDNYTIDLLTDYFSSKGYTCENTVDGKSALELLDKYKPKIILLDIILPDISGYNICAKIKSNKRLKNIPVYYITAVSPYEVKEKTKETGAQGYFLKPFNFTEFSELFDHLSS